MLNAIMLSAIMVNVVAPLKVDLLATFQVEKKKTFLK
jgi:hypothetical protein